MKYEKYLKDAAGFIPQPKFKGNSQMSRDEYLDKLGTKKLKPRIDDTIKELKDILQYIEVSTDAHLYSKKFKKLIINLEKFSNNFKPKCEKTKPMFSVF